MCASQTKSFNYTYICTGNRNPIFIHFDYSHAPYRWKMYDCKSQIYILECLLNTDRRSDMKFFQFLSHLKKERADVVGAVSHKGCITRGVRGLCTHTVQVKDDLLILKIYQKQFLCFSKGGKSPPTRKRKSRNN